MSLSRRQVVDYQPTPNQNEDADSFGEVLLLPMQLANDSHVPISQIGGILSTHVDFYGFSSAIRLCSEYAASGSHLLPVRPVLQGWL